MAFKVLFLAHAPDAEPKKHRCSITTPNCFSLFAVIVKNQKQAIEVCQEMVKKEGIQSILLCPGFTHLDIAEIKKVVGKNVGISVARGDGPSNRIALKAMEKEGWFTKRNSR
ncbi:MAG: DUF6506 family protein [candidate division WOR-3 bacterium]